MQDISLCLSHIKKKQPFDRLLFPKEKVFFTMGVAKNYNVLGVFTVIIIANASKEVCTNLLFILIVF
jgi:hypothetical protein